MDEDQKYGMRLYTIRKSRFARQTIVQSVKDSINAIEIVDGGKRQNPN
jgi:hypothetical protein